MRAPDACDFQIGEILHVADRSPNPHWRLSIGEGCQGCYVLAVCTGGTAHYRIDDVPYTVCAGDVLLLPPGVRRAADSDPDDPWRFFSVGFQVERAPETPPSALANLPVVMHAPTIAPLIQEMIVTWQTRPVGYLLGCRCMLGRVLYELIRLHAATAHNPAHYALIEGLVRRMQADCTATYTVEQLAEMASLSPSYFRTVFKRVTGMSSCRFQNQLRVGKALDLLRSGLTNVGEAAELTGFSDIYYFSRLFKKTTGHAPSYYMKPTLSATEGVEGEKKHGCED